MSSFADKVVAGKVLERFIGRNLNDHGYVHLDNHGTLTLDGKIHLDRDEQRALARLIAEAAP